MFSAIIKFLGCKGKNNISKLPSDAEISQSVQDFLNRPIYKNLTLDIIDSIKDEDLNQSIFDNISANMENDNRDELDIIKTLTKGQQAIYSIWVVEAEVNNGGFNQLYFNGYEDISVLAEEGFKNIGAINFSELIKRANEKYKEIKPELEKFDDGTIESFSDSYDNNPLNQYDDKFYELYETEKLMDLIVKYIRDNKEEFINK